MEFRDVKRGLQNQEGTREETDTERTTQDPYITRNDGCHDCSVTAELEEKGPLWYTTADAQGLYLPPDKISMTTNPMTKKILAMREIQRRRRRLLIC